ncbi:GTPase-associated system all-helical protein GASH [Pseudomonas knackmussii]|uniref:GTPase-associated system all-helical protein GASH n=1 Tax=Pseudomonas knackmussii TaxID=65741 RepID=UPI003F49DD3B
MGAIKPMHQDFARWYETVSLGDDSKRQKRWEGIVGIVASADLQMLEALLRLAFATRQQPAPACLQAVRQCFKNADEAFEMSGNDRELQVLAAAALVALMQDANARVAEQAAIAVTTTVLLDGRSSDTLPMDLAALGEAAIHQLGEAARQRPAIQLAQEPPKLVFDKASAKITEQFDAASVSSAFGLAAESTFQALRTLLQRQVLAINSVDKFLRVQDEELQMLWWLTGQRCKSLDCAFDAVKPEAQPFVFARELSDATEVLPGPASIKAILSRAGLKGRKKISFVAAINGPDEGWLRSFYNSESTSPVLTPIHYAIHQRLEVGGDVWASVWESATGIDANRMLSPLDLSELFYRERLLILFG